MLSHEEKKEMLEDAKSEIRKNAFRAGKSKGKAIGSLDEYLFFLESVQKIFSPFKIQRHPAPAVLNKL